MEEHIVQAVKILNQGGIVIFPTDTAFGIGCRINSTEAIKRLFALRRRPETQATPVLVSDVVMAQEYLLPIPNDVEELLKKYWPGALTIVLPARTERVPELVRGGTQTLGVRMPNHEVALEIIRHVGVPMLGPSANFHGGKTPYALTDLDRELIKLVDYVVPGNCSVKQASTVVDCSIEPWKVLREGAVKIKS